MRFFLLIVFLLAFAAPAAAQVRFSFDDIQNVPQMEQYIRDRVGLGTPKEEVERIFVLQGRATPRKHPRIPGLVKYLYDINLCQYYVFRWNISVDYDSKDKVVQVHLNGTPVFPEGLMRPAPAVAPGTKAKIIRATRDWPQAKKGAKQLNYMLFDADGNTDTVDDQTITGLGASRVDPANFGEGIRYSDIPLWRSIYDDDLSNDIGEYKGSCKEADIKYMSRELLEDRHGYLP